MTQSVVALALLSAVLITAFAAPSSPAVGAANAWSVAKAPVDDTGVEDGRRTGCTPVIG